MSESRKNFLTVEADRQIKALKLIGRWRTMCIGLSAIGGPFIYAGFCGMNQAIWMRVVGIILLVIGFILAAILNLGIKNGKRNVNKILAVIEGK